MRQVEELPTYTIDPYGIHEHDRNGGQGQVCRLSNRDFLLDMKSILVQVNGQD